MKVAFLLAWMALTACPVAWLCWRGAVTPANLVAVCGADVWRAPVVAALLHAVLSAALALALAWPAALGFTQWRFAGRRLGRRLLWLARLCPAALLALPLAALAARHPELPSTVQVALAHLVFNLPVATWILLVALQRVSRTLAYEAMQDGLGLLGHARYVWWPAWHAASVLAFLVCFSASFTEAALTRALAGEGCLAAALPAATPALVDRVDAALGVLLPVGVWALAVGWWWACRQRSEAESAPG